MSRKIFFAAVMTILILSSCNREQQNAAGPRATVTLRDGTLVGGTVVSTSPTEIKILGEISRRVRWP
jgi:hypothetical protein